jgi:hypothetical protein
MTAPWAAALIRTRCTSQVTPLPSLWGEPFLLPAFQRGERWTPEMQAAFCAAVLVGDPVPPILLWERRDGTWVIDGQQRLTALGAEVVRVDGTRNGPTSAFLDVRTGRFGPAHGRWHLTAVRAARWRALAVPRPLTGRVLRDWEWAGDAGEILRRRALVTYVLGPTATRDDAVRAFRAVNTPGVPMSPGEVEALVASAG